MPLIKIRLRNCVLSRTNKPCDYFFSDTDVILDCFQDSSDNNILPSAPPVLELNSKFLDTGSTVQIPSTSGKINLF